MQENQNDNLEYTNIIKKDHIKSRSNSKNNSFVISIRDLDHSPERTQFKINQDTIPDGTQKSKNSSPSLPMSNFKSKIELLKKKKQNEMNNINIGNHHSENDTNLEFTPIIGQVDEPEVKI